MLSDWDPFSIGAARRIVARVQPRLVMCVGRKAHRLLARAVRNGMPIVPMVQKRRFDRSLPFAGVLVAAEHRRRTLIEDGVPAKDIIVIPNAVRLPEHPKNDYHSERPIKIVALGRLHEKKGFGILIAAIARLVARGVSTAAVPSRAKGPNAGTSKREIARARLSSAITLPGWTDDVAAFLSDARHLRAAVLPGGLPARRARRDGERNADCRERHRRPQGFPSRWSDGPDGAAERRRGAGKCARPPDRERVLARVSRTHSPRRSRALLQLRRHWSAACCSARKRSRRPPHLDRCVRRSNCIHRQVAKNR